MITHGNITTSLIDNQYSDITSRISESEKTLRIDLHETMQKAKDIFQEFQKTKDETATSESFNSLSLELDRKIALKKIELMCFDLQNTQQHAQEIDINLQKIGESVQYILNDARDFLPTANKKELCVHEASAQYRLLIAKSEMNKKIALRQMELLAKEYGYPEIEDVVVIFDMHKEMLNLSHTDRLLSLEKRDDILASLMNDLDNFSTSALQ